MNAKVATLGLALGLMAGTAIASNTGFKLNYSILAPAGKTDNNPVSVPYFYYPDGVVGGPQDSVKMCKDVNDLDPAAPPSAPKIAQVLQYQVQNDSFRPQSCTSKVSAFTLNPGEAYVLKPANKTDQVVNIVGSHNDEYARNKLNTKFVTIFNVTGKTSNNYVSVPYHVQATDAVLLCKDVNGLLPTDPPTAPKVAQILQYNVNGDSFRPQSCTSKVSAFTITPGEGLVMKPSNKADQQITFTVY